MLFLILAKVAQFAALRHNKQTAKWEGPLKGMAAGQRKQDTYSEAEARQQHREALVQALNPAARQPGIPRAQSAPVVPTLNHPSVYATWDGVHDSEEMYARLAGEVAGASWTANVEYTIQKIEKAYEHDIGSWGVRGGRNGATIGVATAGIASILCFFLPLLHASVPAIGVILTFTLLGAGFAIGFSVQAYLRHKWRQANPERVEQFAKAIVMLQEAIAKRIETDATYDPSRDLHHLAQFSTSFQGGFKSNLFQALSVLANLPAGLMKGPRGANAQPAKAVPAQAPVAPAAEVHTPVTKPTFFDLMDAFPSASVWR